MVHLLARPGQLDETELRALWRLRTSLIELQPEVDPEHDYRCFRDFLRQAHVGRVLNHRGEPVAMFCHKRIDGVFEGRRYRLILVDYAAARPEVRTHWSIAQGFVQHLVLSRRLGAANYVASAAYPRSLVTLAQLIPSVRLDGDPGLEAIERLLLERAAEHCAGQWRGDQRVVEMRTIPAALSASFRQRNHDNAILRAFEDRVPDWGRGRTLLVIGNLEGMARALVGASLARVGRGLRERMALAWSGPRATP